MKPRNTFMLSVFAILLFNCSDNSLDENILTSQDQDTDQSGTTENVNRDTEFTLESQGNFELVRSFKCNGLTQIEMIGTSEISIFGIFHTELTLCTDLDQERIIEGKYIAPDDSVLYFSSRESGKDNVGDYDLYRFFGGTGSFHGFSAEAKIYHMETFDSHWEGTYQDFGSGQWSVTEDH